MRGAPVPPAWPTRHSRLPWRVMFFRVQVTKLTGAFEPASLPLTTFPRAILRETEDLLSKRFFADAQNDA
jgi:hypothetical protein